MKKLFILSLLLATTSATAAFANDEGGKDWKGHHGGMLQKVDTNHDGVVTKDEFHTAGDKKFDEMDANRDGKITKDEREAFHAKKRSEFEAKHPEAAARHKEFLDKYDTDHDGKLSDSEKAAMHADMKAKHESKEDGKNVIPVGTPAATPSAAQ